MIKLSSGLLKITAIKKRTEAIFFKDAKVGDMLEIYLILPESNDFVNVTILYVKNHTQNTYRKITIKQLVNIKLEEIFKLDKIGRRIS